MRWIIVLAACGLAGCSDGIPTDTGSINPPSKWMMARKCNLPPVPPEDGDPVQRAEYNVKLRRCAAQRGDQVSGLQSYARKVAKR